MKRLTTCLLALILLFSGCGIPSFETEKADFYNYIRGLDALKASLKGKNNTLMLDKDSELVRILYGDTEASGQE